MKILILTQHFYPENFIINDLHKELVDHNFNITVITGKPNYPKGKIFPEFKTKGYIKKKLNNSEIFYLPLVPRGNGSLINLFKNYFSYLFSCLFFTGKYISKNQFDLIFVYQTSPILVAIPGILLKKKLNIPLVIWVQDLWPENIYATQKIKKLFFLDHILIAICKFIYRSASLLLIQSKNFKKVLSKYQISENKIKYFPNFYEAKNNIKLPNRFNELKNKILKSNFPIIFAGNIGVLQSIYTIIDASTLINKNIDIYIIGDGSEKKNLIKYKQLKSADNVIFVDFIEREFIDQILMLSKSLIISYLNDENLNLTIPSKFQNYLNLGKPILGSISGTTADIIKKNNLGFVSFPEDYNALAKNIDKMYSLSESEITIISKNCLDYFSKNFSKKILVTKLLNIFRGLK